MHCGCNVPRLEFYCIRFIVFGFKQKRSAFFDCFLYFIDAAIAVGENLDLSGYFLFLNLVVPALLLILTSPFDLRLSSCIVLVSC